MFGTSSGGFVEGANHYVGMATDSSNNIYITGLTTGDLDGNTNNGNNDIVLVKGSNSSLTNKLSKELLKKRRLLVV